MLGRAPRPAGPKTMDAIARIAEEKIRDAIARGEFDNLPGAGRPLVLDDDAMVPEELRVAYRLLKNAHLLPPEIELRKEILTLRDLLRAVEDGEERAVRVRELNAKLLRLSLLMKRPVGLDEFPEYREKVAARLVR